MRIKITRDEVFIPDYEDNMLRNPDEQIQIILKHLTSVRSKELSDYEIEARMDNVGKQNRVVKYVHDSRTIIMETVKQINNLEVEDENGQVKKITTAKDLLDTPGLNRLIEKIVMHVTSTHGVVNDLKNFEPPLSSGTKERRIISQQENLQAIG